ncbi:MAG TPA: YciI family protein [Streptosporangiaceae bacterium]
MRYLLIHCPADQIPDHAALPPDVTAALDDWIEETTSQGITLDGARLEPAAQARCVRVRDGAVLISDGPFAETKEQVAGYDVIECADLRQAVEVASRHPTARLGAIEIRPMAGGTD